MSLYWLKSSAFKKKPKRLSVLIDASFIRYVNELDKIHSSKIAEICN